jgi:hypothetical protein
MTLRDRLEELAKEIERSESPKESALWALGYMLGVALRVGWKLEALQKLSLWPGSEWSEGLSSAIERSK